MQTAPAQATTSQATAIKRTSLIVGPNGSDQSGLFAFLWYVYYFSVCYCMPRTQTCNTYSSGIETSESIVTPRIFAIAHSSLSVAIRICPSSLERLDGLISTPRSCILCTNVICFIPFSLRSLSTFSPQIFLSPYGCALGFTESPPISFLFRIILCKPLDLIPN